jgi:Arc/MetJ family transcription regulator
MKGPSRFVFANRPNLYLVSDPSDDVSHLRFVESLVSADRRRALVRLSPMPVSLRSKSSMQSLNADIARALGRDADSARVARSDVEGWANLAAWMVADGIEELFVFRAHYLGVHHCERLIDLASLSGARLWLLAQTGPLLPVMRKATRLWPIESLAVDEFKRRWECTCALAHRSTTPSLQRASPSLLFPEVPRDDFFTFWDSARTLLDPSDFVVFDEVFQEVLKRTRFWMRTTNFTPDEECVAEFLRGLMRETGDRNMALTRLRAAQTAFFEEWVFVKADFDRLIGGLFATPPTELSDEAALRLRRLPQARDVALATVALATPLEPAEVQMLTMRNVSADGSRIDCEDARYEIRPHGARFVRAHRLVRLFGGAGPDDQLFCYTHGDQADVYTKRVLAALSAVSRETGLFLAAHWTRRGHETARKWILRRGITVQPLDRPEEAS